MILLEGDIWFKDAECRALGGAVVETREETFGGRHVF